MQPDDIVEEVRRFCASSLTESWQSVEIIVREGNAAKEIVLLAEQLPADVLVLGTHGKSGFKRLFLGSVTDKVLRTTPVPVMTVPPPVTQPGPSLYKMILCPLDFSDASMRALDYALSLAQEADARLILLHVIESLFGDGGASEMGHLSVAEFGPAQPLALCPCPCQPRVHSFHQAVTSRSNAATADWSAVWSRPAAVLVLIDSPSVVTATPRPRRPGRSRPQHGRLPRRRVPEKSAWRKQNDDQTF